MPTPVIITAASLAPLVGVPADSAWLVYVVAAVNAFALDKRQFSLGQRTEKVRGYGSNTTWVRESPIVSVDEVRVDPLGAFGDDTVIDASTVKFNSDPLADSNQIVWHTGSRQVFSVGRPCFGAFPEGQDTAQVTYTAGYAMDVTSGVIAVPGTLRVELEAEAMERFRLGAGKERMKSESIGGYSYTRSDSEIPDKRKAVFRRYRIM